MRSGRRGCSANAECSCRGLRRSPDFRFRFLFRFRVGPAGVGFGGGAPFIPVRGGGFDHGRRGIMQPVNFTPA